MSFSLKYASASCCHHHVGRFDHLTGPPAQLAQVVLDGARVTDVGGDDHWSHRVENDQPVAAFSWRDAVDRITSLVVDLELISEFSGNLHVSTPMTLLLNQSVSIQCQSNSSLPESARLRYKEILWQPLER